MGQSRGTLLLDSSTGTPRKKPELFEPLSKRVEKRGGSQEPSLTCCGEFLLDQGELSIGTREVTGGERQRNTAKEPPFATPFFLLSCGLSLRTH